MNTINTTKEKYYDTLQPMLKESLGVKNKWMVPCIEKVVVNVGTGKILKESDTVEELRDALTLITGQKPVSTQSKKSVAGFKVREGQDVGMKVTLRGVRMWQFLDRVINVALPRVRDFQGITLSSIDASGNLHVGIKEHVAFAEIVAEEARHLFGFQISVVTTARNRESAEALLRGLGFPLQTKK